MPKSSFTLSVAIITCLSGAPAFATSDRDIQILKEEITSMRQVYEKRIAELEKKLSALEKTNIAHIPSQEKKAPPVAQPSKESSATIHPARFNPSIGAVLNGRYSRFSQNTPAVAGFSAGEKDDEGNLEGLSLAESELSFSSKVDDKFYGSLTAALIREEDGEDEIELKEAYVQTLPGAGLPKGFSLKAGRALWKLGLLNEHHAHTDDFSDRPLPYRVFLDQAYNDDGLETSYHLPVSIYSEIGAGIFRGDDYPFGKHQGSGASAWSGFLRIGDAIGEHQNWRAGGYILSGNAHERSSSDDEDNFAGDSTLYIADMRYSWAPSGNSYEQEVILQGEYFIRHEKGAYTHDDLDIDSVALHGHTQGWYAQALYTFLPQWRVGMRYSQLKAPDVSEALAGTVFDAAGHDPQAFAVMMDWTNSSSSRIRFQYNHEELANNQADNQFILQYIMSIGAHDAR